MFYVPFGCSCIFFMQLSHMPSMSGDYHVTDKPLFDWQAVQCVRLHHVPSVLSQWLLDL